MVIDFHTHTFPDSICEKTIQKLSMLSATRASDITDVIANTAGTAVGYLLYLPLGCLWPSAKSNR